MRLARRRLATVLDAVLQQEQGGDLVAGIGVVDQHSPLLHQVVVLLAHHADHRIQQRMAGADEGRDRLPVDPGLLEADALVLLLDGGAGTDLNRSGFARG